MKTNLLIALMLAFTVLACQKKVVSFDDSNPPSVTLIAYQQGLYNKVEVKENSASQEIYVGEGKTVFMLATGYDSMGLKNVKIEMVSGGLIRQEGNLTPSIIMENDTTRDADNNIVSQKNALVNGQVEFNQVDQPVVIRASSADWAGNSSLTPTIVIRPYPNPVARLSASSTRITRGESLTLTYETENADEVKLDGNLLGTFNGQLVVTPEFTRDFILEVKNRVGIAYDTVRVGVVAPPSMPRIINFDLSRSNAETNQNVTASWEVRNATSIKLMRSGTTIHTTSNLRGNNTFKINSPGNYQITLVATGNGTDESVRSLNVTQAVVQPDPETDCDNIQFIFVSKGPTESIWSLNLGNIGSGNKRISKVENVSGSDVRLVVAGRNAIIRAGQSSNEFNGITMRNNFTAVLGNPNGLLRLKFCYDD